MRNFPFRRAESPDPQAFHVDCRARVDNKTAIVTLSDGTQLMTEQDRWWFFHFFSIENIF